MDKFLTDDVLVTDEIMTNYILFLLSGHSIKDIEIRASTIKNYLKVVNEYYRLKKLPAPFDHKSKSDAANLLREQEKFESDPARREPLPDQVIVKMYELAQEDPLSFRACTFEITGLGRYGGFRCQEFAMDDHHTIKTYLMPNGVEVTRAFCVRNIKFRGRGRSTIVYPLTNRDMIEEVGTEYDVQKNRCNGQTPWFHCERRHPQYCPVQLALKLVWRARTLGQKEDDPLCVYRHTNGENRYLTGTDVTKYYRFVYKLVMPNVSDEELKLISTHSLRVTACVLLAEAGKEGWYIKLRLRWLSDCYEIYIRNTTRMGIQHNDALEQVNKKLSEMAITQVNLPEVLEESGLFDAVMYDLEDED
jgi:hypothetical protein